MINRKRLVRLTQDLIRINSENPPGREQQVAQFVARFLRKLGLEVRLVSFTAGRPNVLACLPLAKAKSILLSPHLDTVPAGKGWKYPPFSGKIIDGKIYGRGATDCKGNLAACLEAIQSLREEKAKLNVELIFAATADEESGSEAGIIPLLEKKILSPDAALIMDGDEFEILICQKGLVHFKIKIFGKKAHGAYPWRGVNAIEIASKIILQLKAMKLAFTPHRLLRQPTVNIGTIRGGEKVNMVADFCEFEVDLRFLPGMQAAKLLAQARKIIRGQAKKFALEIDGIQAPYEISPKHWLVASLIKSLKNSRAAVKIKGSEGATVMTFFQKRGIPALGFGFGAEGQAHTSDEYVLIDDLCRGAEVLRRFLKDLRL
jgi:acetylornithine deacetylase/succinyl-diaminopimelate desuccinylase family protein